MRFLGGVVSGAGLTLLASDALPLGGFGQVALGLVVLAGFSAAYGPAPQDKPEGKP